MKRFFKDVSLAEEGGGYAVELDGRIAKTAGRRPLSTPQKGLADGLVAEWNAQEDEIDLKSMPLTRLQGFVIDGGEAARPEWQDTVLSYASSDLLCYRASDPVLAKRQADLWQPTLDGLATRFGHPFVVTEGVIAVDQSPALLDAINVALSQDLVGTVLSTKLMTEILGSAALAIAVRHHSLCADEAFTASRLDETYQAEKWGTDTEATARDAAIRDELTHIVRFMRLSEES
ncbi:MAG: ATP12 family protein [Pseudomonadota bacterium]